MDEKKPGVLSDSETIEEIVTVLAVLALLGALATAIMGYIDNTDVNPLLNSIASYFFTHIWPVWKIVATIVGALAVVGIIYNLIKVNAIAREENAIFNPSGALVGRGDSPKNERWQKVLDYMNSDKPSDWRLAVLEADVMLEELLNSLKLHGDSVGEMLKSADRNEFSTLDDAWEAHKVRNSVAHSTESFQLNERETHRAVALFEKVFKEFDVI